MAKKARARSKQKTILVTEQKQTKKRQPELIELTRKKPINIEPVGTNQENYLMSLDDDSKSIVFAVGPAGTGKTMLATLWAIRELQAKNIKKIVITRPNVAVDDRDIGYLPGDIFEKTLPWSKPILDIFMENGYHKQELAHMLENEVLEICPIAYVRGRTFKNSVVIIDEAQGTTQNSMMALLTRIGDGSKMIVTGDIRQSDRGDYNGLSDFLQRVTNNPSKYIDIVTFDRGDIKRHPAVSDVLGIYGERD